MRSIVVSLLVCLTLMLSACGGNDKDLIGQQEQRTAEYLFERATAALKDKQYLSATQTYEEVERQHPYSELATRAQIMGAYASYQDERYDDAILALNRFIQLHPGNDRIDYAYYLKALCYYDQISDVRRDQDMTLLALDSLETLISRFPESEYRRDAELKRDLTMDHLAGKEMDIGRYYLNRGHINAAINRFRVVVQDYQTTTHVAEALFRLVEGYLTLGIKPEARRIAAILGYNYPGSPWYERSFDLLDEESRQRIIDERDFFDRTVDSIFKPE